MDQVHHPIGVRLIWESFFDEVVIPDIHAVVFESGLVGMGHIKLESVCEIISVTEIKIPLQVDGREYVHIS